MTNSKGGIAETLALATLGVPRGGVASLLFNDDALTDVAVASTDTLTEAVCWLTVSQNLGNRQFQSVNLIIETFAPGRLSTFDWDSDGTGEVVIPSQDKLNIYDSQSIAAAPVVQRAGISMYGVQDSIIDDFDLDGELDVVMVASSTPATLRVVGGIPAPPSSVVMSTTTVA